MTREQAETLVFVHYRLCDIEADYSWLDDSEKSLTKEGKPRKKPTRSQMEQALIKHMVNQRF